MHDAPTNDAETPAAPEGATAELSADLRVAVGRLSRRLRAEKGDSDLSDGQFTVLAYLYREGPRTLGELSDYEKVKPPSMTRTVNHLTEKGLVERLPDDRDGRITRIRITDDGAALVREIRSRRDAWLFRKLDALDPEQRAVLAAATTTLRSLTD